MIYSYFKNFSREKELLNSNVYPMEKYSPEGCTVKEIEELEKKMNVCFPQAYKEYLHFMGKGHRLYWSGVEFSYSLLEELQEQARMALEEEGYSLEHPYWVINTLDEQFHFFYLNDGENPPVYHWLGSDETNYEGYSNGLRQVDKKFTAFIEGMMPSKLERGLFALKKLKRAIGMLFGRSESKSH